ncbi:MAG: hypothetical protein NC041_05835 [Bacteroides sp.]|nr:hypothetical protein [Prevotella sp.]MCM1407476.1 hypothetical protein [Treponema brennaborense]MCM1469966.1 hypothetical protein [Bacteroides sp.]
MRYSFSAACLLLFACCLCCSCSDSFPELSSVLYTVAYVFETAESAPAERLSVFVMPDSDLARMQQIVVRSIEAGYSWTVHDPLVLFDKNKTGYAGYPALYPERSGRIRTGKYTAQYIDGAGRTAEIQFFVKIPESFDSDDIGKIRVSDIESGKVCGEFTRRFLALYDASGALMYFGEETAALQTDSGISDAYAAARHKRICLLTQDSAAAVLLPISAVEHSISDNFENMEETDAS